MFSNTWHHVVIQKIGNSFLMFVDGNRLMGVGSYNSSFNPQRICIGNWTGDKDGDIPMYMDDIRIYKRALSEEEISRLSK